MKIKSKNYRRFFFLTIVLLVGNLTQIFAYDFTAGKYYFDNSKVKFNNVKFVAGDSTNCRTIVYNMKPVNDREWWVLSLKQKLTGVDNYTFIELSDSINPIDTILMTPRQFIDSLSNTLRNSLKCTILYGIDTQEYGVHYDKNNKPSWVFCPLHNLSYTNGYWRPQDSYGIRPSRTLPLIYINTNLKPITTKNHYINGTLWLDNCGIEGYESLGSTTEQLEIEIKGHGNYSWYYAYKKPYKIKFSKKQSPLGLDNSKHFVLMPKCLDYSGYMRNETGFELSRQLDMPYTTKEIPVEVILNNDYIGLYFLCEKIRVESGRVDIVEQEDYETNPYNITGGWLIENRASGNNIIHAQYENNDPNRMWISFESHSPENLSKEQKKYISSFISKTDSCIFVTDKNDSGWEQYIDINSIARFYTIHEVVENTEAFNGSLYMYKDWGENEKFHFGPVWDFDDSFFSPKQNKGTTYDNFIYNYDSGFKSMWIEEICKFPSFQQKLREVWNEFCQKKVLLNVINHVKDWRNLIAKAEKQDRKRWRTYASNHDKNAPQVYIDALARKAAWLNEQWGVGKGDVNIDGVVNAADVTTIYNYILHGESTFYGSSDVNGDGVVNTADITSIYNKILGFNTEE